MESPIFIKDVGKVFKDVEELKEYVSLQTRSLKAATSKIQELQEEAQNLQELLRQPAAQPIAQAANSNYPVSVIEKSIGELLCEREIDRLMNRSIQSELPLEDVKKLDLLVKNLIILKREMSKKKDADIELPKDEDSLIALADLERPKHV